MTNLLVSAVATWNGKALGRASKDVGYLTTGVNKLSSAMARNLSVAALAFGAKSAVSAFAADQKQTAELNQIMSNNGYRVLAEDLSAYISKIQLATGVSDSELRPAYQKLLIATGSYTVAQEGLNLALDVSRGTGKDVGTVTAALSRAYLGNTTALGKLGGGLDKVILKGGNLEQINAQLAKQFAGEMAASAATFDGQMQILNEHVGEGKELIGKSLVEALGKVSGKNGIAGVSSAVDDLAGSISHVIDLIGSGASNGSSLVTRIDEFIFGKSFMAKFDKGVIAFGDWLSGANKDDSPKFASAHGGAAGAGARVAAANADLEARKKLWRENKARMAAAAAAHNKAMQQEKDRAQLAKAHLAIQKLSNKFDMKRIELNAVLLGDATKSQKDAAAAQLALLEAQDKLTLNTSAGATSALALATAQLALLENHNKLVESETALLTSHKSLGGGIDEATLKLLGLTGTSKDLLTKSEMLSNAHNFLAMNAILAANALRVLSYDLGDLFNPDGTPTNRGGHNIPLPEGSDGYDFATGNNNALGVPMRGINGVVSMRSGTTGTSTSQTTISIPVTVQGSVIAQSDLTQAIQEIIQNLNRNGLPLGGAISFL
jgi:hypothetical protein